jgi:hypothetical protein
MLKRKKKLLQILIKIVIMNEDRFLYFPRSAGKYMIFVPYKKETRFYEKRMRGRAGGWE